MQMTHVTADNEYNIAIAHMKSVKFHLGQQNAY